MADDDYVECSTCATCPGCGPLRIQVYSKSDCPWCVKLKEALCRAGIAFEEIAIDASPDNLAELRALIPDVRTVPQMVADGVVIGGFEPGAAFAAGYAFRHKYGVKGA